MQSEHAKSETLSCKKSPVNYEIV